MSGSHVRIKNFFVEKRNLQYVLKVFIPLAFIAFAILLALKIFASTSYLWDFTTAGNYSLSDSNKIQVTGGAASLKTIQTNITDNNQSVFDQGTYLSTGFNASNVSLNSAGPSVDTSAANLVSQWRFENNWNDSKGTNHLTASGNAAFVTSGSQKVDSYSGTLDGTGDYASVSDNVSLRPTALTLSIWIKSAVKYSSSSPFTSFISKNANNNSNLIGKGWYLGYLNGQLVFWTAESSSWAGVTYTTNLNADSWYNLVGTYDGTTYKLYINSVLVNSFVHSNAIAYDASAATIGVATTNSGTIYFNGLIDNAALYSAALSGAQVLTNYNLEGSIIGEYTSRIINTDVTAGATWQNINWSPKNPYSKNLPDSAQSETLYADNNVNMTGNVGLWHFDNSVSDTSGSNNNGALHADATYSTSSKFGSHALVLDGTGDYVSIPDSTSLSPTTAMTVSLWFNQTALAVNKAIIGKWAYQTDATWAIQTSSSDATKLMILIGTSAGDAGGTAGYTNPGSISTGWHLLTLVYDGTGVGNTGRLKAYIDGVNQTDTTAFAGTVPASLLNSAAEIRIGDFQNVNRFWNGSIDELAIFNRALATNEITTLYQRGAANLKFQVRSCDDNACSGENFIGPDGTANTYYSETTNSAVSLPTFTLTNVSNNRYLQYKAFLSTLDPNYKPGFSSITLQHQNYPLDKPSVNPTSSIDLTSLPQTIDHFCEGTLDGSSVCTLTSTKPSGSEIYYQICNNTLANCNSDSEWKYWNGSSWATASTSANSNTASVINTNIPTFSTTSRYLVFKAFLQSSGQTTPVLSDVSVDVTLDGQRPVQNASSVNISGVTSGDWINYKPTISWADGTDNVGGSGILGYCIALDEATIGNSSSTNPETSAGILGSLDDGVSQSYCPYIFIGNSINLNTISGLTLSSIKQYNFSIKAVDLSGNIWTGASNLYQDLIKFKYDITLPTNPAFISMPSNFISTKDATITWPIGDSNAANDVGAGLAGLQYKIGVAGTWYGDLHNGMQNLTDLLTNDGTYTTDPTTDYPNLTNGNNVIYFRTMDLAGNVSSSSVTGVLKINTTAPTSPQNLEITPTDNAVNSYTFSWDQPATFIGEANKITYCYTINTLPTINTCTYTAEGVTSLPADAFANQPGDNILYVVARDEANNINYETYTQGTFKYSGEAPGIPLNPSVADISNKDSAEWKLALTWTAPTNVGAGIADYEVYRTTINANCSAGFGSFSKISTVPGTSYIDTSLTQQDYYYCVKACDSANNCSAVSSTVTKYPTGKYTEPAELISGPNLNSQSTTKAAISWVTGRRSDSRIQYGLSSNDYFSEEFTISAQVTAHTITLNNLKAGTTYYYRARWTDEDGNIGTSEEKSFTTDPQPSIKNAKIKSTGIDFGIISFTSTNSSAVKIYFGKTVSFGGLKELDTSFSESTYSAIIEGLDDGTKYYFKINPVDIEGVEYQGTILDFTTYPRPTVSNIQIEEAKNVAQPTVNVTWQSNTEVSSILSFNPVGKADLVRNVVNIDLVKDHTLKIEGLLASTKYELVVKGIDSLGNTAESAPQIFTTATDTRPPKISNIKIEQVEPNSNESTAQIIVSWDTDELATSQVEFGEGSSGDYNQSTQIDKNFGYKHVVIISNLKTANVYHLRAISEDNSKNSSASNNIVTITSEQSSNALDIVLKGLRDIFYFL